MPSKTFIVTHPVAPLTEDTPVAERQAEIARLTLLVYDSTDGIPLAANLIKDAEGTYVALAVTKRKLAEKLTLPDLRSRFNTNHGRLAVYETPAGNLCVRRPFKKTPGNWYPVDTNGVTGHSIKHVRRAAKSNSRFLRSV